MIIPLPPSLGAYTKASAGNGAANPGQNAKMILALRVDEAGVEGARVLELLVLNMDEHTMEWLPWDANTVGVGPLIMHAASSIQLPR